MNQSLPWHIAEKAILMEKAWLKKAFDFGPFPNKEENFANIISSDEMLRQISISIVSGNVSALEISSPITNGLWTDDSDQWELGAKEEHHGGEWHRAMMNLVRAHFKKMDFEVVSEPTLNYGRADLGIFKHGYRDLFIEIGTTSLSKVWMNVLTMHDAVFLFVPTTRKAIEFKINETAKIS